MRILFLGDIIGEGGRKAISEGLAPLISAFNVDFTIANAENAEQGSGLTKKITLELFNAGINILTSGNHIWDKKEIIKYIDKDYRILRPANFPIGVPGKGSIIVDIDQKHKIGVLNLSGRVFMESIDCPFKVALREVERIRQITHLIVVDIHAEATSEKMAMGWFLDGKVSAVFGTHTHVQTADETILPGGTAYITDVGMTGAFDSVIGVKKELVLERFLTKMPVRFLWAEKNIGLNAAIVEVDPITGRSESIERIQQKLF
jgi:metallophosphoesterase (TIGR00282 family)